MSPLPRPGSKDRLPDAGIRRRNPSPWHLGRSLATVRLQREQPSATFLVASAFLDNSWKGYPSNWSQSCYKADSWMTPQCRVPVCFLFLPLHEGVQGCACMDMLSSICSRSLLARGNGWPCLSCGLLLTQSWQQYWWAVVVLCWNSWGW